MQKIPHNCAICGGQLYIEDRLYFKGVYYHKLCFMQKKRRNKR